MTKVQVRYFDECRDPSHTTPLADARPLRRPRHEHLAAGVRRAGRRHALGARQLHPDAAGPAGGRPEPRDRAHHPELRRLRQDYLAVGVQVRLASRDGIDLNQSCATLTAIDVRRLLHAALADPRLERREPGLPAAHQGRHAHRWLRRARGRVLLGTGPERAELQLRRLCRRRLGDARRRQPQRARELHRHARTARP